MNLETLDLPLSDASKQILKAAEQEARTNRHKFLASEHILLAMIESDDRVAALLKGFGLTSEAISDQVHRIIYDYELLPDSFEIKMLCRPRTAIDHAVKLADIFNSSEVQPIHLLDGAIDEGDIMRVLKYCGVDFKRLREALEAFVEALTSTARAAK